MFQFCRQPDVIVLRNAQIEYVQGYIARAEVECSCLRHVDIHWWSRDLPRDGLQLLSCEYGANIVPLPYGMNIHVTAHVG